VSEEVII